MKCGGDKLKGHYRRALCVAGLIMMAVAAATAERSAQAQSPSPTPSDAQQKLTEEQINYYREQTEKLREERSTWQRVVGLGPFLGALFVASVALVSFFFNYRATLQSQRDTQFYEALKRFGDKDSPALRSSAAGLLAIMGRKKVRFRRPYFQTTLDQFIAGLRLEENPVVVNSIRSALTQLVRRNSERVITQLHFFNLAVQEELIIALLNYFAAVGVQRLDEISQPQWEAVADETIFSRTALKHMFSLVKPKLLSIELKKAFSSYNAVPEQERAEQLAKFRKSIRLISNHLRENIGLSEFVFLIYRLESSGSILKHVNSKLRLMLDLEAFFVPSFWSAQTLIQRRS